MGNRILVKTDNVSKKYCRTLKRSMWYGIRDIAGELFSRKADRYELRTGEFWALKNVSFELQRGDIMGLIGANGTGKSTLLKLINGLIKPDTGYLKVRGNVGALIELGAGFDPLLTGLENIFINGAVLGMSKSEIKRKLPAIIEFSGLGEFMDMPVQNYSSGMKVRLGFAVAIQSRPDVLLIDEVLAVGDAPFQAKCRDEIMRMKEDRNTAVILVSHNMSAIANYCSTALYLNSGEVRYKGGVDNALAMYEMDMTKPEYRTSGNDTGLNIESIVLKNNRREESSVFEPFSDIHVEINYSTTRVIRRPHFWISVFSHHGPLFTANMLLDDLRPDSVNGKSTITCILEKPRLLPQTYRIVAGVRDETGSYDLQPAIHGLAAFRISADAQGMGYTGKYADLFIGTTAPVQVPYRWVFKDGSVASPVWVQEKYEYELV